MEAGQGIGSTDLSLDNMILYSSIFIQGRHLLISNLTIRYRKLNCY